MSLFCLPESYSEFLSVSSLKEVNVHGLKMWEKSAYNALSVILSPLRNCSIQLLSQKTKQNNNQNQQPIVLPITRAKASCTLRFLVLSLKKKNKKTLIVVSLMSAKSTCQMIFCTGQNTNLTSCGSECSLVVIFAWTKLFQTAKFDSRHSKGSVCYYRSAEMWSQFWVERKTREQRFKLMWT